MKSGASARTQGLVAVAGLLHVEAGVLQDHGQVFADVGFVVDDQYGLVGSQVHYLPPV